MSQSTIAGEGLLQQVWLTSSVKIGKGDAFAHTFAPDPILLEPTMQSSGLDQAAEASAAAISFEQISAAWCPSGEGRLAAELRDSSCM